MIRIRERAVDEAEDEGRGGVGAYHLVKEAVGLGEESGGAEGDGEVGEGVGWGGQGFETGAGPVEEVEEELGVEARGGGTAEEGGYCGMGEAGGEVGGSDGELPVAGAAGEEGGHLGGHRVGVGVGGRRDIRGGSEGEGYGWRRRDREAARGGGEAAAPRDEEHGG